MMLNIFPLFVHIRWSTSYELVQELCVYERVSVEISIANYDTQQQQQQQLWSLNPLNKANISDLMNIDFGHQIAWLTANN